jgi:hypothetical protein
MFTRSNFAIFSVLSGITGTVLLVHSGLEEYAGYCLLITFLALVFWTPDGKGRVVHTGLVVVGNLVDGVDLSFMGSPGKSYVADVKRCRDYFCNSPGQVSKMPYSRAEYLVRHWRAAHDVPDKPTPPSKTTIFLRKVWSYLNRPIKFPFSKKVADS